MHIASLNVVHSLDLSISLAPNPCFASFIDCVFGVEVIVVLYMGVVLGCLLVMFSLICYGFCCVLCFLLGYFVRVVCANFI